MRGLGVVAVACVGLLAGGGTIHVEAARANSMRLKRMMRLTEDTEMENKMQQEANAQKTQEAARRNSKKQEMSEPEYLPEEAPQPKVEAKQAAPAPKPSPPLRDVMDYADQKEIDSMSLSSPPPLASSLETTALLETTSSQASHRRHQIKFVDAQMVDNIDDFGKHMQTVAGGHAKTSKNTPSSLLETEDTVYIPVSRKYFEAYHAIASVNEQIDNSLNSQLSQQQQQQQFPNHQAASRASSEGSDSAFFKAHREAKASLSPQASSFRFAEERSDPFVDPYGYLTPAMISQPGSVAQAQYNGGMMSPKMSQGAITPAMISQPGSVAQTQYNAGIGMNNGAMLGSGGMMGNGGVMMGAGMPFTFNGGVQAPPPPPRPDNLPPPPYVLPVPQPTGGASDSSEK